MSSPPRLAAIDDASNREVAQLADAARKRGKFADPPGADTRPEVRVRRGRIHETADAAEAALIATGAPLYARGELLVRLARGVKTPGLQRDAALPALVPVAVPALQEEFERACRFTALAVLRNGETEVRTIGCPPALPAVYLSRTAAWRLPYIKALTAVPVMRADGSVVWHGYDPLSSTVVVCAEGEWPDLAEHPTMEQARAAADRIETVIAGYAFSDETSRAVALAGFMSAVLRPALPTCPLFGFTAPVPGSGKSKLADCLSIIATGRPAVAMAWSANAEEAEKRLGASFIAGDAVVLLDNVEVPVRSPLLCSATTQAEVGVRLLGTSRLVRTPTSALILATGNNLTIVGDLSRRTLICRIDPGVERPELRRFEFDPVAWTSAHRAVLVTALLTISRWWAQSGQRGERAPIGSFEVWCARVRDPLLALGYEDPCASLEELHDADPEREAALAVLREWRRMFGGDAVTVARAIRNAQHDDLLRDALDAVAGGPGGLAPKRLGRYLMRIKDRRAGGLVVRRTQDLLANCAAWSVEEVTA